MPSLHRLSRAQGFYGQVFVKGRFLPRTNPGTLLRYHRTCRGRPCRFVLVTCAGLSCKAPAHAADNPHPSPAAFMHARPLGEEETSHAGIEQSTENGETGLSYCTAKGPDVVSGATQTSLNTDRGPPSPSEESDSFFRNGEGDRQRQQFLELAARLWDESRRQGQLSWSESAQGSPCPSPESTARPTSSGQIPRKNCAPQSSPCGDYTRTGVPFLETTAGDSRKMLSQGSNLKCCAGSSFATLNDELQASKRRASQIARQFTTQPADDRKELASGKTTHAQEPSAIKNRGVDSCRAPVCTSSSENPSLLAQRLRRTSFAPSRGNGQKTRSLSAASLSTRLSELCSSFSARAREGISRAASPCSFGRGSGRPDDGEAEKQVGARAT